MKLFKRYSFLKSVKESTILVHRMYKKRIGKKSKKGTKRDKLNNRKVK